MVTATERRLQLKQDRMMLEIEASFRREIIREKNRYIDAVAKDYEAGFDLRDTTYETHYNNMSKIMDMYHARAIQKFSVEVERIAFKGAADMEYKRSTWEYLWAKWLSEEGGKRVKQVAETTRMDVSVAIKEGIDSEEPTQNIIKRILLKKAWSPWRADAIARTETHTAAMYASVNTAKKINADFPDIELKKKWIPVQDERTRISHSAMANHEAISLDAKFQVGRDKMDRPSDPTASAANVISCRCVLVYENSLLEE